MNGPAQLLYLCQDGWAPSGVATYGFALLEACPHARMLLLNADAPPANAPATADRLLPMETRASHDARAVADRIAAIVGATDGPVVVLPNTGDTPWTATAEFLRGADAATRARVRVLGIVHSDMETQYALAERYRAIAPCWIGVSHRCAAELRRRLGAGAAVEELPYPMDPRPETPRPATPEIRLAYVGRLEEPQKRVSRLPALFAALAERGVAFSATVAGDGPAAKDLAGALAALGPGVTGRVRLAGPLDRAGVAELWQTHDVALLVSAFEGLPLALLEAMAAGVCPVAMAIESGLDQLIRDGVNGRVVPQGDVAAMAAAIATLAGDRAAVRRLGAAARRTVAEQFSTRAHLERLAAIVARLARTPAPDAGGLAEDPTAAAVDALAARAVAAGRPIAVFGAGMIGRKVVDACRARGAGPSAWFDSDPAKAGLSYGGLACEPLEAVAARGDHVFVAASLQFGDEMRRRIAAVFAAHGLATPPILSDPP